MILLTVGTQLPFDRMVRLVDVIAPDVPDRIVAQIGHGRYRPEHMEFHAFIDPIAFEELLGSCRLVVSHAGIGTLVMAQRHGKPVIMFPRLASLHEHRNDHQLATVSALARRQGVYAARNAEDLRRLIAGPLEPPSDAGDNPERGRLCDAVAEFLAGERDRWHSRNE